MPPKRPPPQTPLYVKIPTTAADKLDRAAAALGVHKKDLVADLVTRYVSLSGRRTGDPADGELVMGTYSFQPYDPPEVMNAEQAGQFLQIETHIVIELAEGGKLPGKKLGPAWRFSREALVAWLSTPEVAKR
ncbi:MAG: helix-turn-helix domain-containing protein [Deltaproteobacteria bacterium]|nr:helix-turn-helix domain-containing protein [Deltaproteobacteria bacterium]